MRPFNKDGSISDTLIDDPDILSLYVSSIPDVYVIPWYNDGIFIDWSSSSEELTEKTNLINKWVAAVEQCDPWVEQTFGIKGTGEGLVFYPRSHLGYANFSNLCFKAKGEAHKNISVAKPAQADPSVASNINEFVEMVLTNARLEQGVSKTSNNGEMVFDIKNTGKFVSWISKDIEKETQDELQASNLTWKQVQKSIEIKARNWYLEQVKKI